jgi:N-acetylglucosaminyldiphosphoundecaprenol N-acetyl-beta-D-mannosaminyltransferase
MSHLTPAVPVYDVCGISIAAVSPPQAAAVLVAAAQQSVSVQVHLCNVYTLSLVEQDQELRSALRCADLNLPDGTPVAWLGWQWGVRGPVRGPGLVPEVGRAGAPYGLKHYLYGGAPGVAEDMAGRLRQEVPGIDIVGAESPPYRTISDDEVAELTNRIQASGANVVWIGLGTPRQDYLVPRVAAFVDGVVVPVGAAFDFLAGRVGEAPRLLHGTGLEWLYRFSREPKRLWRRYLIGSPRFLAVAARYWWCR